MARIEIDPSDEQALLDLAASNPKVYKALVDSDPRVRLFEVLHQADKKLNVGGKELKYSEVIEEMGVQVAPDSNAGRARRLAAAAIADDVTAIKTLRKDLEDREKKTAETKFTGDVREAATQLGFTVTDKDLGDIVTFMKDNEYGPKAVKKAVEAFFEGREPAEPNFVSDHTFQFEDQDSSYIKKITEAPPFSDLSQDTLVHAERTWRDMFGRGGPGAARKAITGR